MREERRRNKLRTSAQWRKGLAYTSGIKIVRLNNNMNIGGDNRIKVKDVNAKDVKGRIRIDENIKCDCCYKDASICVVLARNSLTPREKEGLPNYAKYGYLKTFKLYNKIYLCAEHIGSLRTILNFFSGN